jgi:hypothetical protein
VQSALAYDVIVGTSRCCATATPASRSGRSVRSSVQWRRGILFVSIFYKEGVEKRKKYYGSLNTVAKFKLINRVIIDL